MPYDLFISYSRKDNANNRVTELKERIEVEYLEYTKEELKCFFDKNEIAGMDDWKHQLLGGLKDSNLLLLILSPNYLDSPYCEWEIVEYLKYEYARATQGEGVAQIYFIEIPGIDESGFKEKAKAWLEKVSRRQRFDFREWYDEGSDALKRTDVKNRLDELNKSLQVRIARMRRIVKAPGNLPAPNSRFVGREREMKLLHESVGLGKFSILTAVHGMGGLGKTAIAFQYAYTYADFYPGGRWQIGCANDTNLGAVLKKLDLDLKVTFTEDEKKDDTRGAKRIINELETLAIKGAEACAGEKYPPKPSVLLLLDNVDHAELIQPPNSDLISGKEWLKILVTTRMGPEELSEDETKLSLLTIDELPFEDALRLIESYQPNERFKDENEKEKAGEIVKILGGFTLAVEVAALYIYERKGQITCAAFLELLIREGGITGIDIIGTKTKTSIRHDKLISATLSPTLDILLLKETLLLSYAALLPPDNIPVPWLRSMVINEYPELGTDAGAGLDDPWLTVINHLLSLRLLQIVDFDKDGFTPRILRIHRLTQELVVKRNNNVEGCMERLATLAVDRSAFLKTNWHNRNNQWEISTLMSFADILVAKENRHTSRLVKSLGQWIFRIYPKAKCKVLFKNTVDLLLKNSESNKLDIAIHYSNIGLVANMLEEYVESKKYLELAIEIDEKYRTPNDRALAVRYVNLAHAEEGFGNLKEAKSLIMKAIEIEEKAFEKDHLNLSIEYYNLSSLEVELGNLKEAKELSLRAIAIWREKVEKDHPNFASGYSLLGSIEYKLGNLGEAKELFVKAIIIDEKVFDKDHPNLVTHYTNLGFVEGDLENLKEAESLFRKALAIREKSLPLCHPDTIKSYRNLANLLEKSGQKDEAKFLRLRCLEHESSKLTPLGIRERAKEYYKLGVYGKAEELLNRLLETGFELANTYHHQARIYLMTDRLGETRKNVENGWSKKLKQKRTLWPG
jgi:tetratricopeptide (TPR) repeat protein